MLPQLLGNSTAAAVVALTIRVLTLGTVPEEQQPPLLLEDELLLLLALLGQVCRVLLVARAGPVCRGVESVLTLGASSTWQA